MTLLHDLRRRPYPRAGLVLALAGAVMLGACGRDELEVGAEKTGFPGQVTAGGSTSGEVMARAKPQVDTSTGGTPGIPQGSGGNTGGAAMGGTSGGSTLGGTGDKTAAQTPAAQPAGEPKDGAATSAPASSQAGQAPSLTAEQTKADAAAKAEQEKQQLAAAMGRIGQRWRERAAIEGWPANQPTPVEPVAGIEASNQQSSASGQPGGQLGEVARDAPVRSEKLGTAPPSEDVKQPQAPDPGRDHDARR